MLILRVLWLDGVLLARAGAVLIAALALFTAKDYLRYAWRIFELSPDPRSRAEYRVSDWLWRNLPDARVKASGSVRFWLDAWRDILQLGGGSDQGLINGLAIVSSYQIDDTPQPGESILWMQCLGVDAVYAAQPQSEEVYKQLRHPYKFAGVLPVLFDDRLGNVIYKVPRRYAVRARVVETARFNALEALRNDGDTERLRRYLDVIERGPESVVTMTRQSPEAVRLRAHVDPGQSIMVQETYDPAWRASSGGKALPIRQDVVGFIVIDPPPGDQDISLRFVTPMENRIGGIITLGTLLSLIVLATYRTFRIAS